MAKLRVLSGKDVCRILEKHDFANIRQRGSHVVMQKKTSDSTITVPVPQHSSIRKGTLLSIIRQSQIPRDFFAV